MQGFQDEWQKAYFVDCSAKLDKDVTDVDIAKYNLILFGDKDGNLVAGRVQKKLPLQVAADRISIAGKTYEGRLGYEFAYPNPLSPEKYIVMIGMNQWRKETTWKLHLSRDGIYDYVVYDLAGSATHVHDAGYFDQSVWLESDKRSNIDRK